MMFFVCVLVQSHRNKLLRSLKVYAEKPEATATVAAPMM
jgi:hypothetical protein